MQEMKLYDEIRFLAGRQSTGRTYLIPKRLRLIRRSSKRMRYSCGHSGSVLTSLTLWEHGAIKMQCPTYNQPYKPAGILKAPLIFTKIPGKTFCFGMAITWHMPLGNLEVQRFFLISPFPTWISR